MDSTEQSRLKILLVKLLRELSYAEGDFVLSSGQKSNFYIDVRNTSLHPEGARLIGELGYLCLKEVKNLSGVGGPTLGADPIATAISLRAWADRVSLPVFLVRKEPKRHGTESWLEGLANLPQGSRVVVVEDTTTTGDSSLKAVEKARAAGLDPVGVMVVVDRGAGAAEKIKGQGLKFWALTTVSELKGN